MLSTKTTAALFAVAAFGFVPAAYAQVGGGNEMPNNAQSGTSDASGTKTQGGMSSGGMSSTMHKGGMMKKHHRKHMRKHHSM